MSVGGSTAHCLTVRGVYISHYLHMGLTGGYLTGRPSNFSSVWSFFFTFHSSVKYLHIHMYVLTYACIMQLLYNAVNPVFLNLELRGALNGIH